MYDYRLMCVSPVTRLMCVSAIIMPMCVCLKSSGPSLSISEVTCPCVSAFIRPVCVHLRLLDSV